MYLEYMIPIAGFPAVGFILQGATQILPQVDIFEKYGPLGLLACFLMWQNSRQAKQIETANREMAEALRDVAVALGKIQDRPCLYELEFDKPENAHRKDRRHT